MGDPDAHPDPDIGAANRERLMHDLEHPVRDPLGHNGFDAGLQDDGELVATQAGQRVPRAEAARQTGGHLNEHMVTGVMAEAVVYRLESV